MNSDNWKLTTLLLHCIYCLLTTLGHGEENIINYHIHCHYVIATHIQFERNFTDRQNSKLSTS